MNRNRIIAAFFALLILAGHNALAQSGYDLFQKGLVAERTEGDLDEAIRLYKQIVEDFKDDRALVAKTLVQMGGCYEKLGTAEARTAYERVVRDFADQSEIVAQARVRLAALGGPGAAGGLVTRRILADASGVSGVLTADGKYIRGIDWDTGDVVQFEVASGQTSRITNRGPWSETEKSYEYQAFSRDGKQIAYNSYTKDWDPQLRIRNLDGSDLRTLYSEKDSYVYPLDWSPDAGAILARRYHNKAELTLISTADGSVRVLRSITSVLYSLKNASFSPDGRFVAFSLMFEGSPPNGDVFLMTADGRNEVVVAGHPADDHLLGWTPDGRSLVFLSDRSGTWDIWTVHITGGKQQGEPELLKKDFGYYSEVLGFAPDGSCYYKTDTALGGFYNGSVDLETGKVLVPPAPATTRYTGPPSQPTWSPDGKSLLYLSRRGSIGPGNNILTIRSAATGEERFLSPRLRFVNQISWAPDGRSVIALGITETETAIFRIDTETSGITKLADRGYSPRLCPDGKILVFVKAGPIITKRNLDTGEESEVVKPGSMFYDLSPDGREVVFQVDGAIKAVSLDGGEPRELFRGPARPSWYYRLEWTRDGRYIIVQARNAASSEILLVPAQGGTPLKLDLSVPKLDFFTLHPDNRRFAFSVNEKSKSELWVLENFLPKSEKASGMVVRRVWANAADSDFTGVPSPDGKYLTYVDWTTGDPAVRELATGKNRRLTNEGWDKGFALNSIFSPDSKQVAYYWWNNEEGAEQCPELRIVGLDGSEPRVIRLNKGRFIDMPAGWSADGKHILALGGTEDKSSQILLIPVEDGDLRVLKTLPKPKFPPARWKIRMSLSPDGRYVAYTFLPGEDSANGDISVLAIDGSRDIPLVRHPADDFMLGWAPDGKRVVFASDRTGSMGIWAIEVADGKPQGTPHLLKPEIGKFHPMGFSQNGSYYYGVASMGNNVYVSTYDPQKGNVTGKPVLTVKHYEGSNRTPDWSPDGRYLACVSRRPGVGRIFLIHSVETGEVRELSPDLKALRAKSLRWSADGRSLLCAGKTRESIWGVLKIDVETGKVTIIVEGPGLFYPNWSADGKAVFYVRRALKGWQILRRDLTTNEEKELFRPAVGQNDVGAILGLALSPDGKQLAFQDLDAGMLKILSVAGGQPRELVKFNGKATITWTPEGSHLLYANRMGKKLWRISAGGGEPQKLDLEMPYANHVRFHPDGRRITFAGGNSRTSEVWTMENFLPESNASE